MATVPEYLDVVVPGGQSFDRNNYAGIFHFRFWRFGEWLDVVVDDRLPTTDDSLVFCHNNQDKNEMFGPLLEKAYAKLNMCYSYLDGGESFDAMVDLTGGVHESFDVKYSPQQNEDGVDDGVKSLEPEKLWDTMYKSYFMKSLMGCAISTKGKSMEHVESNGLVLGHAYTILSLFEIMSNGQLRDGPGTSASGGRSTRLIRMRNPWGQSKSFTGRWSANAREWDRLDDDLKMQLNAGNQSDGEFFICFEDFVQFFDEIGFVHVNMNAFYDGSSGAMSGYKWVCQNYMGEFVPGRNSGGCGNDDPDAYWINPQYPIQISNKKTSIIVSMIQCEQSRLRDETDGTYEKSNEAIAFSIYKCVGSEANISKKFSSNPKFSERELDEVCASGAYVYMREKSRRFQLDPGYYIIIPSLFEKNRRMRFLLRVFTKGSTSDPSSTNMRTYPVNNKADNRSSSRQNDNNSNNNNYQDENNNNYNKSNDNQNNEDEYNQNARRNNNYEQENEEYQRPREDEDNDDDGYGERRRGGGGRHHRRDDDDDDDDRGRGRGHRGGGRDDRRGGDDGDSSARGRGRRRKNYNAPSISINNITDTVVSNACLIM